MSKRYATPAVAIIPGCIGGRARDSADVFQQSLVRAHSAGLQRVLDAFATGSGSHSDHFAQFDTAERGQWTRLDERQKSRQVECAGDGGYHGDGTDPDAVFPRNGDESRPWSSDPRDEIRWGQYPADRPYTIYDGNYLNWFHSSPTVPTRRLAVLKEAASTLLSRMDGVNVGLVATNFDQGGSVLFPLEDIATARTGIIDSINAITPDGWSPLSETLYEAGQYFAGRAVEYGAGHGPQESAPGSRDPSSGGAAYASPLRLGCQKNHIVLLTGGTPTQDADADARIAALPDFSSLVGPGCDGAGDGACLDDMAAYLFAADLSPSLPGHQNVVTHVIGLEADMPLLASTAIRGGGTNFTSTDGSSLLAALTNTFTFVRDVQTHFAAPTVPVDSFNRLRNADDLYLAVFRPTVNTRWPGNIKKYRLRRVRWRHSGRQGPSRRRSPHRLVRPRFTQFLVIGCGRCGRLVGRRREQDPRTLVAQRLYLSRRTSAEPCWQRSSAVQRHDRRGVARNRRSR